MRKFQNKVTKVHWKLEATNVPLLIKDLEEKIEYYKQYGQQADSTKMRNEWLREGTFNVDLHGYIKELFVRENGKYIVYSANVIDDNKNQAMVEAFNKGERFKEATGSRAIAIMHGLFKEKYSKTFKGTFGSCDRPLIHKCVPKQLYYIDRAQCNKIIPHVGKVDVSSQYPANMCGRLPTWKGHLEVVGTVLPTEEYPFAFYVKSGHSAEYGVYDTHEWVNHPLRENLFGENFTPVPYAEDKTILCKAADYELTEIIQFVYSYKQRGEYYKGMAGKAILNTFIGIMHPKNLNWKSYRLEHLATVALARANQNILDLFDKNKVLQIIVDSIIYKSPKEIGVHDKYLGALEQEWSDCDFKMMKTSQWLAMKDGKYVAHRQGGIKKEIQLDLTFEGMEKWNENI